MIICKATYGSYEKPCIRIQQDPKRPNYDFYLLSELDSDACFDILARIEYCQKNGIPFEITGFRTDKEKYPNG